MKLLTPLLKSTDKAVLKYLYELTQDSGSETCKVSIPKIASECCISERQVQISTRRLIEAKIIERVGYDFSNPIRSKRGTIYKVLNHASEVKTRKGGKKKSIKFILVWCED
jgi:DNA-binding Lrp family transcriptional regulator